MEVKELRIGNLVNTGNFHLPRFRGNYKVKEGWFKYASKFKPIPLTEEWLLKFGFEYHKHQENMFFITGMQVWMCNDLFLCNKNGIILKSVHQLQNLYFALTNKELNYETKQSKRTD